MYQGWLDSFLAQHRSSDLLNLWQWVMCLNSLAPGRCDWNLKLVILRLISMIDIFSISYEIALMWMPQDFTNGIGSIRLQAITSTNVDRDLFQHMASLGYSRLKCEYLSEVIPIIFTIAVVIVISSLVLMLLSSIRITLNRSLCRSDGHADFLFVQRIRSGRYKRVHPATKYRTSHFTVERL